MRTKLVTFLQIQMKRALETRILYQIRRQSNTQTAKHILQMKVQLWSYQLHLQANIISWHFFFAN